MKRKSKGENSIYSYLKSKGVLENGTHEEIQRIRVEYWKEYKRKWRVAKRIKDKEFTISFNKDELKILNLEAKRYKLSRTQFIKQTTFAYIDKSFIVPDIIEVKRISQLLALTHNSIQELYEDDKINSIIVGELKDSILILERELLPLLYHPRSIEVFIKEHIGKNTRNKAQLLEFINSL